MSILGMRFHGWKDDKQTLSPELETFCTAFLDSLDYRESSNDQGSSDYRIARIIEIVFRHQNYHNHAIRILENISSDSLVYYGLDYFDDTLTSLAKTEPVAVLDYFFGDLDRSISLASDCSSRLSRCQKFLKEIPKPLLFKWSEGNTADRPPRLAWQIQMIEGSDSSADGFEWCELSRELMDQCSDFAAMMDVFIERMYPRMWSGSYADILESRADMLESIPTTLKNFDSERIQSKAAELRKESQQQREYEKERNRSEFQSFE